MHQSLTTLTPCGDPGRDGLSTGYGGILYLMWRIHLPVVTGRVSIRAFCGPVG